MNELCGKKIAIDTMILIYLLEKNEQYWRKIVKILDESNQIIVSSLLVGEILTGFYKTGDEGGLAQCLKFIDLNDKISVKPFDTKTAILFAKLRAKNPGIKAPDCIHLATALHAGAEFFLTNDGNIKKMDNLEIVSLNRL